MTMSHRCLAAGACSVAVLTAAATPASVELVDERDTVTKAEKYSAVLGHSASGRSF